MIIICVLGALCWTKTVRVSWNLRPGEQKSRGEKIERSEYTKPL